MEELIENCTGKECSEWAEWGCYWNTTTYVKISFFFDKLESALNENNIQTTNHNAILTNLQISHDIVSVFSMIHIWFFAWQMGEFYRTNQRFQKIIFKRCLCIRVQIPARKVSKAISSISWAGNPCKCQCKPLGHRVKVL